MGYWIFIASVALFSAVSTDEIYSEEECNKVGGICKDKDDCPEGYLAGQGLCPKQQDQNVECCNKLPETECSSRGGICRKKCPDNLSSITNDCPSPLICCDLV